MQASSTLIEAPATPLVCAQAPGPLYKTPLVHMPAGWRYAPMAPTPPPALRWPPPPPHRFSNPIRLDTWLPDQRVAMVVHSPPAPAHTTAPHPPAHLLAVRPHGSHGPARNVLVLVGRAVAVVVNGRHRPPGLKVLMLQGLLQLIVLRGWCDEGLFVGCGCRGREGGVRAKRVPVLSRCVWWCGGGSNVLPQELVP